MTKSIYSLDDPALMRRVVGKDKKVLIRSLLFRAHYDGDNSYPPFISVHGMANAAELRRLADWLDKQQGFKTGPQNDAHIWAWWLSWLGEYWNAKT